jgi:hypothetical protein
VILSNGFDKLGEEHDMPRNLPPTEAEMKTLTETCQRHHVVKTAIETDVLDRYLKGKFNLDGIDAWLAKQQTKRPHLFEQPTAHQSLEALAFAGSGNVTARGKLVKEIGEKDADKAARSWGLSGLHDFTRQGAPVSGEQKAARKADRENPWSEAGWNLTRQGALVKAMGIEKAASMARAAHSYIGATRPTKAAKAA